ncbi:MAG: sugar ABC transporter permease [Clostridia bacterium]|nr:sugar ABC transporter permease [Clostridia bacterium]
MKPNVDAKGRLQKKKVSFAQDALRTPFVVMLLPFLILFLTFTIIPICASVVLSFFDYDVVNTPSPVGLGNYLKMFINDYEFPIAVANTLKFSLVTGPISFAMAFLLAWMINEFGPKTRSILSFLFYSPALVGNGYFIWQIMFSGDSYGYVNSLLLSMGLITSPITWFRDPNYAFTIVMIVQLWMSMGISFLANIAGLNNVDESLYEAGAIDGVRNRWAELWYITIPSMKSILLFSAVMQVQATFSISSVATTLTGFPSVNHSTETILTHITDVGTVRFDMGYASALSVFLFAMMMIVRLGIGRLLVSKD